MGNRLVRNISSDTRILIAAAIAGLMLYVFVLPSQHPDTVLHSKLSRSDAAAAASTFLVKHGYATTGLEHQSRLSRNPSILKAIMDSSGREYFIESMDREQLETLPAYYWNVTFFERTEENTWNTVYNLQLTPTGKVWNFANVDAVYLRRTDRAAIRQLFASRPRGRSRDINSDSLTTPVFDFNSVSFPFKYAVEPDSASLFVERGEAEENAGEYLISPQGAAEIAQFHLGHYELAGYSFRPDSVDLEFVDDEAIAKVRFKSTASQLGQRMSPVVSITSRGALYNLDVDHDSPASVESNDRMESVAMSITGILFFVVGAFLIVTFFRRLIARLIDVKAALVDAFVFSTLLVLYFVFVKDLVFGFSNVPMWLRLLMPVLIGSFVGGGMSVLLFLVISSADSLARPHWPKHLMSASLLRQGRVMNARVGQSLVRGVLFGFVLLGINVLILVLLPWAKLSLSSDFFAGQSIRPIVSAVGMQGFLSYVQLGVVLLAVLAFARKRSKSAVVVIVATIVVAAALQMTYSSIRPIGLEWLASGAVGAVIGVAFLRFDLVTVVAGYFIGGIAWILKDTLLVGHPATFLDFGLGFVLILVLLMIGMAGIIRGAPMERVSDYVPDYIRDLRQQERLQHELSIAQQVQESFLPREMPKLAGLDVAARCLAAEEVGGDYYDFISIGPKKLAIAIGDVSGKGIQAAFFMTLTKGFLRTLCREYHEPADVLKKVNTLFCENATPGMFISMIYGILDLEKKTFTFARAGHNPIMLKRGKTNSEIQLLQPSGLGIGLAQSAAFDRLIEQDVIQLGEDDTLVLFTDGFSEAMNSQRELFGDDRLTDAIANCDASSAKEMLDEVRGEVDAFVKLAERHDDMTMIVVKFDSKPAEA